MCLIEFYLDSLHLFRDPLDIQKTVKNHVGCVLLRKDLSNRVIHVEGKKKYMEMESVGGMNMGTIFLFLGRAFEL